MKIIHVLPSSGDQFYCENCVRDNALLRALVAEKADVVALPLYLPQSLVQAPGAEDSPIFFGGINSWLQQKSAIFRHTPRWIDRLLDSRLLLNLAAKRAGSARATDLGDMTLSMLQGRSGHQKKELDRMLAWLDGIGKPDVVHVSNTLLLGLGHEIKERLGVPIVCSLQDEDTWLDAMHPEDAERCWSAIAERAGSVDAFLAVSRYYGDQMRERIGFDQDRLHVVPVGIDPDEFETSPLPYDPPVLGFLSRMGEEQGLGVLVDAFLLLRQRPGLERLRLSVAGGSTADDRKFLKRVRKKLAAAGALEDARFEDGMLPETRRRFLKELTVLSVPTPKGTAFGTYVLEAAAAGVPVVQPRIGSYPELVGATAGGCLYDPKHPGDAETLADTLGRLLEDRDRLRDLGRGGRASVEGDLHSRMMARAVLDLYGSFVDSTLSDPESPKNPARSTPQTVEGSSS